MKNNNANLWSTSSCNRLVAARIAGRQHAKHIENLTTGCRAVSDHNPPVDVPHLRKKGKKQKLQEDRAAEIQTENRILLQKMLSIDTKPTEFSPFALGNERVAPRSICGPAQRRELDRITNENQGLLRRLQSVQSDFDVRGLNDLENDRLALKCRLSQNSCRGRTLNLPMPKAMSVPSLPRIGPQRFKEDDWARLTNNELDNRLLELEQNHAAREMP